jgi:TorA maturation chaperone TorD
MRTSLINIAQIEAHLLNRQHPGDALLFDAKLMLDHNLQADAAAQQKVYSLVQQYGRRQLKQEIEAAYQQLFTQPEHLSFKQKIARFFNS